MIQIQYRRDTAANWTANNPTLAEGEPGYETDTGKFKVGDGATNWVGLAYSSGIQGDAATIAVGTVSAVPNGTPPTVTNVGTPAAAIFDFELEAGVQGIQGIQGIQGDPGEVEEAPIDGTPYARQDAGWVAAGGAVAYCDLTAKTASDTLSVAELAGNVVITNTGAGGAIEMTLQAGAADYSIEFEVTVAQYLKVTAAGSDTFGYGATVGAAGGYVRSNVIGTRWKLTWNGTRWSVSDLIGVLNADE